MCQFSHLSVLEGATISEIENFTCQECGKKSNPRKSYIAVYAGHRVVSNVKYDYFKLFTDHNCPNCGENFVTYREICKGE